MNNINQYKPQIAFHPGETLSEKLAELGMGPKEFAIRTGKPEKTIIAVIKGRSSITAEMAVRFENVLGIPAHFWLNMQMNYNEFLAREEFRRTSAESINWVRSFPAGAMIRSGWLPGSRSSERRLHDLLAFFGISDHHAWEDYYLGQKLKVAFRISLVHTNDPYAISAWLRKGELQAAGLTAPDWDAVKFRSVLDGIKKIMAEHSEDFSEKLQAACLEAGVKVVYTHCLPKAPITGSTRWINSNPVIQLSGRYKRNDIFWFTFFHEAGHILLHGRKDVFLEITGYRGHDTDMEKQADDFARTWTLSDEEEQEIVKDGQFTEARIRHFAAKFNTHPAIITGRLQHDKLLPYKSGSKFFKRVEFR